MSWPPPMPSPGDGDGVGGRLYPWCARYADEGGLTPTARWRRETVRIQAAELFEQMIKPSDVARRLRVSVKSAYQWHQLWRDGGGQVLASRGPSGSRCRLSPRSLEKLAGYLEQGPARSSPCAAWSGRHGPHTAGTPVLDAARD
ncbi:helix-turn-helix domain-containing protein [Streptomyces griseofuscus]|uniref:helix-turn-helix domain-containing protein n=1 Tax=Streptomyces griseofuscus TaxID=146922 RepID=UPI003687B326